MDFQQLLDTQLLELGDYSLTAYQAILSMVLTLLWIVFSYLGLQYILPRIFKHQDPPEESKKHIKNLLLYIALVVGLLILMLTLGLDRVLYSSEATAYDLLISNLLEVLLILQVARLADWLIYRFVVTNYDKQHKKRWYEQRPLTTEKTEPKEYKAKRKAGRMIQSIIYAVAIFFLMQLFRVDELLPSYAITETNKIVASNIVLVVIFLLFARLFAWILIQVILHNYYRANQIDVGSQFALNQLVRYFIFFFAILIAIQNLSIELTVVWGSIAALMVGLGLGLQQTFNDWVSGIILLFEQTVEVNDIIQLGDTVGTVRKIGLRTSRVETLENITRIVPNSQLTNTEVVNWSHYDNKIRFVVKVGVAYGSDTTLVKQLLLEVAQDNMYVLSHPKAFVRFVDFGASSLDFELHFWSRDFLHIEDVKSELRFNIDAAFRKHNVQIPFPQMDVWMRGNE